MLSLQSKLDRTIRGLDDANARDDVVKKRPDWWHACGIVLGLLCAARPVQIALLAAGPE
jgi:hypothetical protein